MGCKMILSGPRLNPLRDGNLTLLSTGYYFGFVWATVEPFEGWKLRGAGIGKGDGFSSGPRLNPLRDGNNELQFGIPHDL